MPKIKLTNTFIKRVPLPKTEKIRYIDTQEINLILEVKSNGVKCFYYRYQTKQNKTAYKKIDNYPTINLNEARQKVNELKDIDAFLNDDVKKSLSSISLHDFYHNHYYPYIKTSKISFKEDNSFYKNHILPEFGNLPMHKITRVQITTLHAKLKLEKNLSNSVANKLIKFLSYTYNLAISWDIPNVISNPCKYIKLFKDNEPKERFLNKEEIKAILYEASKVSNPLIKPLLEFLLLTGTRKSEALNAKWKDIDELNNILNIPSTKSGKPRKIPISTHLIKVINSIPKHSQYLFPSSKDPNKPLKDINFHWYKIREKLNLTDVRIHDFRHTFASTLVNNKVPLYDVQKLLGHSSIAITQRYAHLSNQSLQSAVDVVGEVLE